MKNKTGPALIKTVLFEYGLAWATNRLLYAGKLKAMKAFPGIERFFEKKVLVKETEIFSFNVPKLKIFLKTLPAEEQKKILKIADNAANGLIFGFSSLELDYLNPINWHYDPIKKKDIEKNIKWYSIPDFNEDGDDIKAVWEASRFTHFHYFTRAYLISEDKKYYDVFSAQLAQWLRENPYSFGANFKCGQESALRMINILIAYAVFRFCGATTAEDEQRVKELIELSYRKIVSNFFYAHKCIKNNHALSEIAGMIIGAWCCDDKKRLRQAYKLFDMEIQKQFLSDGGYIQYSFNYQRLALQVIECVLKLTETTGSQISEESKTLIKKSVHLMYQMQDESGEMPNYGSNDGALILPVTVCEYTDYRPTLNSLYAILSGKRLYGKGNYDEELLWFGAAELAESAVERIIRTGTPFSEAGLYSLRHENGFLMVCLQNFKSRPAHMDQLHIDLWDKGVNLFCDSGTFSYADKLGQRLSLTAAHNTAKLEGLEQMKKKGAFFIFDWTKCSNVQHSSEIFEGTMTSRNGYIHQRKIQKIKNGYALEDEVTGDLEYCDFYFHTPCEVKMLSSGFQLFNEAEVLCSVTLEGGSTSISKAYGSRYYLKKEEITCISVRCPIKGGRCSLKSNIRLSDQCEVS